MYHGIISVQKKVTRKPCVAAEYFKLLDVDGDGSLSLAEMETVGMSAETFRLIDADSSGTIDKAEFRAWSVPVPVLVPMPMPMPMPSGGAVRWRRAGCICCGQQS